MRYSFIATEGIQDVAFISKILKNLGFSRERYKKRFIDSQNSDDSGIQSGKRIFLNEFWYGLVPTSFPVGENGYFIEGVPLPWFWRGEQMCVAVQHFTGISNFIAGLQDNFEKISPADLFSIGFVLDADENEQPSERFEKFRQAIKESIPDIPILPDRLGVTAGETPKTGFYIFPDNVSVGTLEDLLLDCADVVYPNIKRHAGNIIEKENEWLHDLNPKEKKEYQKDAGKNKLTVANISSIMKPGRAVQNTIEDFRWVCNETMSTVRVQGFVGFLEELLDYNNYGNQ